MSGYVCGSEWVHKPRYHSYVVPLTKGEEIPYDEGSQVLTDCLTELDTTSVVDLFL